MIKYRTGMSRTKSLSTLMSIINTANKYPGSLSNLKIKGLINKILKDYPDPLYKQDDITIIKNRGSVYMFNPKK